jgi:hypothetical protein
MGKLLVANNNKYYMTISKNDRCTRCHKKGHLRRNCPDTTPQKWEQRFDSQKANYWVSIAKWQAKATSAPSPPPTGKTAHPKKTIKVKADLPEHHMNILDCGSDHWESDEEESNNNIPRAHYAYTIETDEDSDDADHTLPVPDPAKPATMSPYASPRYLRAMEGSHTTPYEPPSDRGTMEGSSIVETTSQTANTRTTRP